MDLNCWGCFGSYKMDLRWIKIFGIVLDPDFWGSFGSYEMNLDFLDCFRKENTLLIAKLNMTDFHSLDNFG